MNDVTIYVLTHTKVDEDYDSDLYVPLLNGSARLDSDFGYVRDDTGDNISELNNYYAELTGQYWAWKNSEADIIGFCHYRRWFVKNLRWVKLTKKDILDDLKEYDMIVSQKSIFYHSLYDELVYTLDKKPDYNAKLKDYLKLKDIIEEKFPEYYQSYEKVLHGRTFYGNNMFICNKELLDKFFTWQFDVLDEMMNVIDFSEYPEDNKRVLGFFAEHLLNVFIVKHNLKVKERYVSFSDRIFPILTVLHRRFPILGRLENEIFYKFGKKGWIKSLRS